MAPRKRQRDYKAEYARRTANARSRGFGSYYQQRIRGGKGASPSAAAPTGPRLRQARGHASISDLKSDLRPGDIVEGSRVVRNDRGQIIRIDVTVHREDGSERSYRLQGKDVLSKASLEQLELAVEQAGADVSFLYPLRGR